jgi:hypothetical protein
VSGAFGDFSNLNWWRKEKVTELDRRGPKDSDPGPKDSDPGLKDLDNIQSCLVKFSAVEAG